MKSSAEMGIRMMTEKKQIAIEEIEKKKEMICQVADSIWEYA